MKNIIVLHYKTGAKREVRWGSLPAVWHVPVYFKTDEFKEENEPNITSTVGRKTFELMGKVLTGHLWWKKIYGHYYEEGMESPHVEDMFDVRKENRKEKV